MRAARPPVHEVASNKGQKKMDLDFLDPHIRAFKSCFEGRIDFVGQESVEKTSRNVLWTTAGIAFIIGFILQSLRITFLIFGAGVLGCAIAVLPAWPTYNSHPVQWLAPAANTTNADLDTKKQR